MPALACRPVLLLPVISQARPIRGSGSMPWLSRKPCWVVGIGVGHHAVVAVAGASHERADEDVRHVAGHRIERDVDVVDPRRLVEPRRLGRVVPFGHEHRAGCVECHGWYQRKRTP